MWPDGTRSRVGIAVTRGQSAEGVREAGTGSGLSIGADRGGSAVSSGSCRRSGRTRGRSGSRPAGSGSCPGMPIDYTPTEPLLVVEVDADPCFEQGRWRHATAFRRVRGDLQPTDVPSR